MAKKNQSRVKWEVFCDEDYYSFWGVRPVGDRDFNSPRLFHFTLKIEADEFKTLLDKSFHAVKS